METAIKSVGIFLLIYFSYYYVLRFIQSVFQGALSSINAGVAKFIYALSTPAHELAHLLVAILCLAKIEQVQLLPKGNRPGFIRSRVGSSMPFLISIKEFLIAIAPVIINIPLFIFIESKFVLKDKVADISRILDPRIIVSKEGIITIFLFLVLISGIAPSHEDFKGMIKGLIILSAVIFGLSFLTSRFLDMKWMNAKPILTVLLYYIELIVFVLIINAIIHYRNCFKITRIILISAIKHAFRKS